MRKIHAIGYIDRTVSGDRAAVDESEMHCAADLLGYQLTAIVYGFESPEAYKRLLGHADADGAGSVFVPSKTHLSEDDIEQISDVVNLYCIAEELLYTINCEPYHPGPDGTPLLTDMWDPRSFPEDEPKSALTVSPTRTPKAAEAISS